MRIGIDARLWRETGVGRYIRNLVKQLQVIDHVNEYVLFVLSKDATAVQSSITNDQWLIIPADVKWHTIQEQRAFPKILEKEKLDLMHFPYFSVPIGYKGKYVLTIHDLILHHFPTGKASTKSYLVYQLKLHAYKYIISHAAKNAAKIITVSNATKEEIVEHLRVPQEKVVVTYEGVDTQISNKDSKFQIPNSKFFLYVGNAYPHKNLEKLLQAFQSVKRKALSVKDLKLVLVGKQDYFYKRLEEEVQRMGLGRDIIFRHNVTDEELALYYQHALALVIPSLMEGFGLPLLEAMEENCLVVASDIPVFREIAGDIPLYFPPTDVNRLKDMLESIAQGTIQDEKNRKIKGQIQAKKFSWKKMAQETLATYKSSLSV